MDEDMNLGSESYFDSFPSVVDLPETQNLDELVASVSTDDFPGDDGIDHESLLSAAAADNDDPMEILSDSPLLSGVPTVIQPRETIPHPQPQVHNQPDQAQTAQQSFVIPTPAPTSVVASNGAIFNVVKLSSMAGPIPSIASNVVPAVSVVPQRAQNLTASQVFSGASTSTHQRLVLKNPVNPQMITMLPGMNGRLPAGVLKPGGQVTVGNNKFYTMVMPTGNLTSIKRISEAARVQGASAAGVTMAVDENVASVENAATGVKRTLEGVAVAGPAGVASKPLQNVKRVIQIGPNSNLANMNFSIASTSGMQSGIKSATKISLDTLLKAGYRITTNGQQKRKLIMNSSGVICTAPANKSLASNQFPILLPPAPPPSSSIPSASSSAPGVLRPVRSVLAQPSPRPTPTVYLSPGKPPTSTSTFLSSASAVAVPGTFQGATKPKTHYIQIGDRLAPVQLVSDMTSLTRPQLKPQHVQRQQQKQQQPQRPKQQSLADIALMDHNFAAAKPIATYLRRGPRGQLKSEKKPGPYWKRCDLNVGDLLQGLDDEPEPSTSKDSDSEATVVDLESEECEDPLAVAPSSESAPLESQSSASSGGVVAPAPVVDKYQPHSLQTAILIAQGKARKLCTCTKSMCLKLYCDCFAQGEFCVGCNCLNCFNNMEHEEERQLAVSLTLERNPAAFRPKIGPVTGAEEALAAEVQGEGAVVVASKRHNRGCKCKKSYCLKNYCECFEAKILCTPLCRCHGCKNQGDEMSRQLLAHLCGAADVEVKARRKNRVASRLSVKRAAAAAVNGPESELVKRETVNGDGVWQEVSVPLAAEPEVYEHAMPAEMFSFHSSPDLDGVWSFFNGQVIEATCMCLIGKGSEGVAQGLSSEKLEESIIQECKSCLDQIIRHAQGTQQMFKDMEKAAERAAGRLLGRNPKVKIEAEEESETEEVEEDKSRKENRRRGSAVRKRIEV